jgi:hypothetical protein
VDGTSDRGKFGPLIDNRSARFNCAEQNVTLTV